MCTRIEQKLDHVTREIKEIMRKNRKVRKEKSRLQLKKTPVRGENINVQNRDKKEEYSNTEDTTINKGEWKAN